MNTPSLDSIEQNEYGFKFDNSYLKLPELFYSKLKPTKVKSAKLVIINNDLAMTMGLKLEGKSEKDTAALLSGNIITKGSVPFAQAYAGHQFGHFTMLGDGRAHVWGEHIQPDRKRVDIQYKGSGRTPYSRGGDGRASLGPMLREYIISEAMAALGIPTTRSLAVVSTGEDVIRETVLPGAILTRVASSHIRVGTFEYSAIKGNKELVNSLLNYTINRHYPEIENDSHKALSFLKMVINRQIDLIVNWMRVGFIHGVMNTDNMCVSGETIDYGPCAFMDTYHPDTVFSSIDHMKRYAYANQPIIAQWNITRLAETLLPLISEDQDHAIEMAKEVLSTFMTQYDEKWTNMMRSKLGLFDTQPTDKQLVIDLLDWMKKEQADYTNTFRALSQKEKPVGNQYETDTFSRWHKKWQLRLELQQKSITDSVNMMKQNNPMIIPRNHNVEKALKAAIENNIKPFNHLLNALQTPYEENNDSAIYQTPPSPDEQVYQTFCGT